MKVLMVTDVLLSDVGNGVTVHQNHLNQQLKNLCELTVLHFGSADTAEGETVELYEQNGIRVVSVKFNIENHSVMLPLNTPRSYFRVACNIMHHWRYLKEFLESEAFDIVHFQDYYCSYLLEVLFQVRNKPKIVSTIHALHGSECHLSESLRNHLIRNSNRVIAVSQWQLHQIEKRFPVTSEKIHFIYNGVDLAQEVCSRKTNSKYITFSGRLELEKGCDLLLQAASMIRDTIFKGQYRIVIMGKGSQAEELKMMCRELRIDAVCDFLGEVPYREVQQRLESSSLHVVPSRLETFGLSAVEALVKGIPTLASSAGALPEIIDGCPWGYTFKDEDISDLAQKMLSILSDPSALTSEETAYKLETIKAKFSWEEAAQRTFELYENAMAESSALL